jgi:pyruvate-formate lyase
MSKCRKGLVDNVLDRASDLGRDSRNMTRRALTGKKRKKKGKKSTRKLVKRNNRAIDALIVQLDQYIKHDRARDPSRSSG